MINLEWLRTFKTIYEKGSMTAAAETLFISQPGVSLHLSSLEEHIGHQLFERAPRKLRPTERGNFLYNAIADSISKLEEVEASLQQTTSQGVPSITVGMCFETFQETLEPHMAEFDFDMFLEFDNYGELLQKLEKGLVDVVVTPHKGKGNDIIYTPVSQENIILVAGKEQEFGGFDSLLKKKDREGMRDWLMQQRWYGITGDNEHMRRFWKQNFKSLPDFRPNYIVPNIHSVIRSLSTGPGLAVVPDFLCLRELKNGSLHKVWSGFTLLTNTLYAARRKHSAHEAQLLTIEGILKRELPDWIEG